MDESTKICRSCLVDKSTNEFYSFGEHREYLQSYCKPCVANRTKISRRKHQAKWSDWSYKHTLKRRYGITIDDYDAMLLAQSGGCAICGRKSSSRGRLHVDHSHEFGYVRGLLCDSCNSGIGRFKDNSELLNRAAEYLMVRRNA